MSVRRVVVTGIGILSPTGNNQVESWQNILSGESGVQNIEYFDTENFDTKFAATLKNFHPENYLEKKEIRRTDKFIQYGMIAAAECLEDAFNDLEGIDLDRMGVAIGSGIGGLYTIEENNSILQNRGPNKISPFFVPGSIINMVSGYVSLKFNLRGPNISIASACSSASHSIGYSFRSIAHGDADIMLTGGSEMAITPLGLAGFNATKALSVNNQNPKAASRPWDESRDGFVLGEGAGCLMLEEYKHARNRGANIYAEIVGFGMSADAYHITQPGPKAEGGARAMRLSLKQAKTKPEEVDYINAHGTSTPLNDKFETMAIKSVFGEYAYTVPISSTKSMTGHLLGASGALEAVISVMSLQHNIIPPTINLQNADPECDLDYTPNKSSVKNQNVVMSNSFGFGGHNSSLIFAKAV